MFSNLLKTHIYNKYKIIHLKHISLHQVNINSVIFYVIFVQNMYLTLFQIHVFKKLGLVKKKYFI